MGPYYKTCRLLLCIFLCFHTDFGFLFPSGGELSPPGDLYQTSHVAFELNCTLTTYEGNGNSSNMEFKIFGSDLASNKFPKEWQAAVSEDTLRLRVPQENVTKEASGHYHCMMHGNSIAVTEIIIGDNRSMISVSSKLKKNVLEDPKPMTLKTVFDMEEFKHYRSFLWAHFLLNDSSVRYDFKSVQPTQAIKDSNSDETLESPSNDGMIFGGNFDYSDGDNDDDEENSDHPPKPVTNLTCVSASLDYMDCTFCPEVVFMTDYTFSWAIDPGGSKLTPCDLKFDNNCYTCHFAKENFRSLMMHYVEISGHNIWSVALNRTYMNSFSIDPATAVRANLVRNLHAVPQSSSSMLVTWDYPMSEHLVKFTQLQFYVTYKNDNNGETFKRIINWNNSVLLKELRPHTSYTVSVQSKPKVKGYWSDISHITNVTREDAPSSGPGVAPGAFRISCTVNSTDCNTVYVYWQAVPELERNGIILGYEINCTGLDGHFVRGKVSADDTYFKFERDKAQPYEVEIVAYTSAGTSPPSRQTVPFPLGPGPRDIDAEFIKADTVEIKWKQPVKHTSQLGSYSLVSCLGNRDVRNVCKAPARHLELPADSTGYNLTGQNGEQVYAIAANYFSPSTSSGLAPSPEWICVYQFSGKPPVPMINSHMFDTSKLSLEVSWNPVSCRDHESSVRILYYKLIISNMHNTSGSSMFPKTFKIPGTDTRLDVPGVTPGNTYFVEMWAFSKDQSSGKAEKTIPIAGPIVPVWLPVVIILLFLIVGGALSLFLWRCAKKHCATVHIQTPEKPGDLLLEAYDQTESGDGQVSLTEMVCQKPPEKLEPDDNHSNSSGYESLKTTNPTEGGTPSTSRQTSRITDTSGSDQIEPYPKVGPNESFFEQPDIITESAQGSTYPYPDNTATGSKSCNSYLGSGVLKQEIPRFDEVAEGPPVPPSYDYEEPGDDSGDGVIWEVEQTKPDEEPPQEQPCHDSHTSVLPALCIHSSNEQVPPHCVKLEFDGGTVEVDLASSLINHGSIKLPSLHSSNPTTAELESADYVESGSRHSGPESDSEDIVQSNSGFSSGGYK